MPTISAWEEKIAQDEHSPASLVLMLSDWRADRTAMINRFQTILQFHDERCKELDPRSKKYYYHAIMQGYTSAILLALCGENIHLLRGE